MKRSKEDIKVRRWTFLLIGILVAIFWILIFASCEINNISYSKKSQKAQKTQEVTTSNNIIYYLNESNKHCTRVLPGEGVWSVAKRSNVSPEKIICLNKKIQNRKGYMLYKNEEIIIGP